MSTPYLPLLNFTHSKSPFHPPLDSYAIIPRVITLIDPKPQVDTKIGVGSLGSRGASAAAAFRSLSSVMAGRGAFGLMHGLPLDGLSFNGRRDTYQAFGFPRWITPTQYNARYRRGGIAHRIVEVYPRATWGGGIDIVEDQDPKISTPFESACADLFERLIPIILRADKLANICQYSVILIGAPGELSSPLPRVRSIDDIPYFNSYGQNRARITKINTNPLDPLFGTPEEYTITIGTADYLSAMTSPTWFTGMTGQTEVVVHASRIIHVAEGCLEDNIYGQPRLEPVWNLLDSLDKIIHAGGEQAYRGSNPPTFLNLDPQAPITEGQEQAMDTELQQMIDGFQTYGRLMGTNVTVVPMRVPVIKDNAAAIAGQIGGTLSIPQRILVGSEMGHLASTQDENNFDDEKDTRKKEFAAPLAKVIIDRMVLCGAIPAPKNPRYEIIWPSNKELTETERATVTQSITLGNANQVKAEGKPVLTSDEIREKVWEMDPLVWEVEPVLDPNADPADPADPNADSTNGDVTNPDDSNQSAESKSKSLTRRSLTTQLVDNQQQIVLIGGARVGKSTLAAHFRSQGIPTYCGDPLSKVKDPEEDVTYLPEGMTWSDSSSYIAANWFSMPSGWCCEGIAMVRALRKWVEMVDYDPLTISNLRVIYLKTPAIDQREMLPGQLTMLKAVETIWQGIKEWFPQVEVVEDVAEGVKSLAMGDTIKSSKPVMVSKPVVAMKSHGVMVSGSAIKPIKQHGFKGLRVAVRSPRKSS